MSRMARVVIETVHVRKSESYGILGIGGEPGSSAEWNLVFSVGGQSARRRFGTVRDDTVLTINFPFVVDVAANQEKLEVKVSGEEEDDLSANDVIPSATHAFVPGDNWQSGQRVSFAASDDNFDYTVTARISSASIDTSTSTLRLTGFSHYPKMFGASSLDGQNFGRRFEVQGSGITDRSVCGLKFDDRLYLFCKGAASERMYVNSALHNQPFGNWEEVQGGGATDAALAATVFDQKIYLFSKNTVDRGAYFNIALARQPFSGWNPVQPTVTDFPLATAVFGGRLLIFAIGTDSKIYASSAAPNQPFNGWGEVPSGGTDKSVSGAVLQDRLYLFATGFNNHIYVRSASTPELNFGPWADVPGRLQTNAGVSAAMFRERLFLAAKGVDDDAVYITSMDQNGQFSGWARLAGLESLGTPALVPFKDRLFVFTAA